MFMQQQQRGFGQPMFGSGMYPPAGTNPGAVGPVNMWQNYAAALPEMERARDRNISGAMATAGLGGNRFSTNARNDAARIGADVGLSQNRLLSDMLYNQTNENQNRALQSTLAGLGFGQQEQDRSLAAASQGMQLGQLADQMMRNRYQDLWNMGTWETDRAQGIQQQVYADWMANRLGYLPMLMQYMGGQWGPNSAAPSTASTGGTPGLMDYATTLLAAWLTGGAGG